MNRTFFNHIVCVSTMAWIASVGAIAQTTVTLSVQSTAGGSAQSSSFNLVATVGQLMPGGQANSAQFSLFGGFIYTLGLAPTVTTNPATNVGTTSVILNGMVNPNGLSTVVKFEYGTTTSYGSGVTATQSPVTGTNAVSVSAMLTSLAPNTTYHYRVVGTNNEGTTYGANQTFTTGINPLPIVTTIAATNVGTTSATLNGMVNPNGLSTTVKFQYGTTTSYGNEVAAAPSPLTGTSIVAVSATLTGLTPNTTHHYRVVGTNSAGTTHGENQTFTTLGITPTVTTNTATNVSSTSATLNGTVNPNGLSTTVKFQYGTTPSYGNEVVATPSPVTGTSPVPVSASISGLTTNTVYHYRVFATNSAGTSNGADQTFTTNRPPVVANPIPNQMLRVGGAAFARDLNAPPVFNDPDGDPLTYTTRSSAPNVATASLVGSMLTVAPVARGNAIITVTANDGRGGIASNSFILTVSTIIDKVSADEEELVFEQTTRLAGVPADFVLEQNFPNPFWIAAPSGSAGNPATLIRFGLPVRSVVTIKIFTLSGHEVATLFDNVELPPGLYQSRWDGRDAQGRAVVSGIYFYRLIAGSFAKTMKMTVMR
jgi:hypothetical protein